MGGAVTQWLISALFSGSSGPGLRAQALAGHGALRCVHEKTKTLPS